MNAPAATGGRLVRSLDDSEAEVLPGNGVDFSCRRELAPAEGTCVDKSPHRLNKAELLTYDRVAVEYE